MKEEKMKLANASLKSKNKGVEEVVHKNDELINKRKSELLEKEKRAEERLMKRKKEMEMLRDEKK